MKRLLGAQESAIGDRACGDWGTRDTSSETCRSVMHDYIGRRDVLFCMYNNLTGAKTVSEGAELPKDRVVGRASKVSF